MAMRAIEPTFKSATRRRELRQRARNALGTSSASPPAPEQLFRALMALEELTDLTTNGRYTLALYTAHGELTPPHAALNALREESRP